MHLEANGVFLQIPYSFSYTHSCAFSQFTKYHKNVCLWTDEFPATWPSKSLRPQFAISHNAQLPWTVGHFLVSALCSGIVYYIRQHFICLKYTWPSIPSRWEQWPILSGSFFRTMWENNVWNVHTFAWLYTTSVTLKTSLATKPIFCTVRTYLAQERARKELF